MSELTPNSKPWWRMHPLIWLGLLLLAAVSLGFSAGTLSVSRFWIAWSLQIIDPRSWPSWVAYPLWGAACWQAVNLLPTSAQGLPSPRKSLIVLAVLGLLVWWSGVHLEPARRHFYLTYYVPFITNPITNYMRDGHWDQKVLILPVTFVSLIGLLILLRKNKTVRRQAANLPPPSVLMLRPQLHSLIVLVVLGLLVWHNGLHLPPTRAYYYQHYYVPYVTGPMSRYLVDGYWDWSIFILPTTGLVVLGSLIGLLIRLRRNNNNGENGFRNTYEE